LFLSVDNGKVGLEAAIL